MYDDITDVPGILVGHDTMLEAGTGCTVVVCAWPAVGGVDVRGGAPGTRETDLLDPSCMVSEVHAVLLAGGSAFGLDAAAGVMRVLESRGVGFDVGVARVPIVPGAVIFDLGVGRSDVRPDAEAGARAAEAAAGGPIARGSVGAGTGATVGKWAGPGLATKGGVGSASAKLAEGHLVGALLVVNALGDIYDPATGKVVAGARNPAGEGWLADTSTLGASIAAAPGTGIFGEASARGVGTGASVDVNVGRQSTIGVVATDLPLTKAEARRLAMMAHDGLALAIRPTHTPMDGDTIFALSLATPEARAAAPGGIGPMALATLGAAAARVVARAAADAVRAASALHGVPAAEEGFTKSGHDPGGSPPPMKMAPAGSPAIGLFSYQEGRKGGRRRRNGETTENTEGTEGGRERNRRGRGGRREDAGGETAESTENREGRRGETAENAEDAKGEGTGERKEVRDRGNVGGLERCWTLPREFGLPRKRGIRAGWA